MKVRDLEPGDEAAWRRLWADYLSFYREDLAPEITDRTWARLMDPASIVKARVAVAETGVVGFAVHMHHPSTWAATDDCYLEDLFVAAEARGLGAGRALIDDLISLARHRGWSRLYWHTDHDNTRARVLYDSYIPTDGAVRYRMKLR